MVLSAETSGTAATMSALTTEPMTFAVDELGERKSEENEDDSSERFLRLPKGNSRAMTINAKIACICTTSSRPF